MAGLASTHRRGSRSKLAVGLLALAVATACGGATFSLPTPADSSPEGHHLPHEVDTALTASGRTFTDSSESTGSCVFVWMWATAEVAAEWKPVSINSTLVDEEWHLPDGSEVFCTLAANLGPSSYELSPELPAGWYAGCNLDNRCSEPFHLE